MVLPGEAKAIAANQRETGGIFVRNSSMQRTQLASRESSTVKEGVATAMSARPMPVVNNSVRVLTSNSKTLAQLFLYRLGCRRCRTLLWLQNQLRLRLSRNMKTLGRLGSSVTRQVQSSPRWCRD